jgi:hypothetical protein
MHHSTRNRTLPFAAGLALAALLLGAGVARAEDDRRVTDDEFAKVKSALESRGYTDIRDVEVDDGQYEVDARNKAGRNVDLEVDMKSLEVLYEDAD